MRGPALLAAAILLMMPAAALAHHSLAPIYDMAKTATVEGRLTRADFINPHATFEVSVREAAGAVQIWKLESRSTRGLERAGITANTLRIGAMVKFVGNPARNGTRLMWPVSLETGGATFDLRRRPAPVGPQSR